MSKNARQERPQGIALIAMAGCLWGTAAIASRFIFDAGNTEPVAVGFYRLALSSVCMVAAGLFAFSADKFRIDRKHWPALVLIGLSQAAYNALFFAAVSYVGVIMASLIALCSAPVLVSVLSAQFLGEKIRRMTLLAIVSACIGVVLLVGWPSEVASGSGQFWLGVGLAGGAALAYATFVLSSWTLAEAYHPFVLIGVGFGLGALCILPVALAFGLHVEGGMPAFGAILYMALIATALAYFIFYFGLRWVAASATGIVVLLEPLTSAVLASLIFDERLGPFGLAGAGLLFLATALTAYRTR